MLLFSCNEAEDIHRYYVRRQLITERQWLLERDPEGKRTHAQILEFTADDTLKVYHIAEAKDGCYLGHQLPYHLTEKANVIIVDDYKYFFDIIQLSDIKLYMCPEIRDQNIALYDWDMTPNTLIVPEYRSRLDYELSTGKTF